MMRKRTVDALFIHDFKYLEYKSSVYGEGQFEYNLWKKKYLTVFKSIVVVARGSQAKSKNDINNKYKLDGKAVQFVSTDSLASLQRLLNTANVKKIIAQAIDECDVAVVRLPSIQGLIACALLEKSNKPYIVEVVGSGFDSLWYHDRLKGKIMAPILHSLNKKAIQKASNVIYVTDKYLQKVYPNSNNTIACSDVIIDDLNPSVPKRRISKIDAYTDRTVFKLGLVGSYDVMYKGHEAAIKAVARIIKNHEVELHFLGSGSRERWLKIAIKYGVENSIVFDSPLNSGREMQEWLDEIDVLLVPSKTEGMPRVLLESMSRAGVIVASDVGDIPYVIHKDDVVKKHDWKGLARRVEELLNNKELMRATAKSNFNRAKDFDITRLSVKRDKFILDLIEAANDSV